MIELMFYNVAPMERCQVDHASPRWSYVPPPEAIRGERLRTHLRQVSGGIDSWSALSEMPLDLAWLISTVIASQGETYGLGTSDKSIYRT